MGRFIQEWLGYVLLVCGLLLISRAPELLIRRLAAMPGPATQSGTKAGPRETTLPPFWSETAILIDKFGEAVIVAAIIALVVDKSVKKLLVENHSRRAKFCRRVRYPA